MSKQLATSAALAIFAMAATALALTPDFSRVDAGEGVVPVQAELMPDLPMPSFFN